MRIPESLASLADLGIIEEVVRPLMSGKEAQVYLVVASGEQRVAKIYKEAQNRTFKHRAEYTEGRKTRNTRDQRAIGKRTAHGRAQDEAAWRSTEVDTIFHLQRAGVRVPVPYTFIDGVLIMELITDADGDPAPRLGDVALSAEAATAIYDRLLREVVRMLCAGVVHGDLSDFNVLMAADGPVLIDFPQSVDPAHNPNARKLLLRDVNNLHDFVGRFVRHQPRLPFAEEMWELYQANGLTPDTPLSGRYRASTRTADVGSVLSLIDEANRDERRRREFLGIKSIPASLSAPPVADSRPRGHADSRPRGPAGPPRGHGGPPAARPSAPPARTPPGGQHAQDRRPAYQRRPPRPDERHRPADPPRAPHPIAARPAGPTRPHAQPHLSGPARPHGQAHSPGAARPQGPAHSHGRARPQGPAHSSGPARPQGPAHPPGARGFAAPPGAPNGRKKRRHRKGPPPSRK
jgi:RIO kinase 1